MQIQKKGIRMRSKLNNNVSPKLYIPMLEIIVR